ncbi:MAG: LON peptidase substrate-binding domain-containing protein [Pseudomonadota bacterium]
MQADADLSEILALFPLQTVLFPGNKLPLRIFEPRYVDLVGRCMREQCGFGIIGIVKGQEAGPVPEIFSIGTEVSIIDFDQGSDGFLNIVVQGRERFAVKNTRVSDDNLLSAIVSRLPALAYGEQAMTCPRLEAAFAELARHPELMARIEPTENPIEMAYQLLPWLPISNSVKVAYLEETSAIGLISRLEDYLHHAGE